MSRRELRVQEPGDRLDRFLAARTPEATRGFCRDLILQGLVTVDGAKRGPDYRLREGERVLIEESGTEWPKLDLDSWLLHEDKAMLALAKPSGVLMHPLGETWLRKPEAALADEPNLAGLMLKLRPEIAKAGTPRCGIVHRLDRATSGVLVVAKTPAAYEALTGAFAERLVSKTYRAIVLGEPAKDRIDVDAPVGRQPGRRRMEVLPWGRPAQTEFSVRGSGRGVALIEARPKTGRTHQIRVHLAEFGHPVLGDPEWIRGPERARMEAGKIVPPPRMMLHAYRLELAHPATRKAMRLTAPVPRDFKDYWKLVGQ